MGHSSFSTTSRNAGATFLLGDDGCGVLAGASAFSSCLIGVPGAVEGCEVPALTAGMLSYCRQLTPANEDREVCMFAIGGSRGEGIGLLVCDTGR